MSLKRILQQKLRPLCQHYYYTVIYQEFPAFNIEQFIQNTSFLFLSRYNKARALTDIKSHQMQILFSGGRTGGPGFNSKEDRDFQKRYNVSFYSPGSVHFGTDENEEAYNQTIFACLDKRYGKAWRYELRTDAIGFIAPDNQTARATNSTTETNLGMQFSNPGQPENNASEELTQENPETGTSVWWYIMPTSGFTLLLGWYLVRRKKKSSDD